ncbi:MAG: thermonuclease family protein [Alphaproteobacteria bacterium]
MRNTFFCLMIAAALFALPHAAQAQAKPAAPKAAAPSGPAAAPMMQAPAVPVPTGVRPAAAGDDDRPSTPLAPLPERIQRPMRAIDPMTLRAEGQSIRLWGIRPASTAETPLELKALDLMDGLIQEGQVNCRIMPKSTWTNIVARCSTSENQDLALELLSTGFVVVDRDQTYGTVFATSYETAQEKARLAGAGVWKLLKLEENPQGGVPAWLKPHMDFLLPFALIFGPFGGLVIVGLVMWYWLKRMATAQEQDQEQASRKEAMLLTRERQVLVTTLEGELSENKNKIDAFLVIYGDMLQSLKDPNETPKYQQGGDIVQKHPRFSRTVFESNVSKLSLLDIKLAGKVSKLYSSMPKEEEYINLEPGVPLETAVQLVEKVLKDAETLIDPINTVIGGLQASLQAKNTGLAAGVSSTTAAAA